MTADGVGCDTGSEFVRTKFVIVMGHNTYGQLTVANCNACEIAIKIVHKLLNINSEQIIQSNGSGKTWGDGVILRSIVCNSMIKIDMITMESLQGKVNRLTYTSFKHPCKRELSSGSIRI